MALLEFFQLVALVLFILLLIWYFLFADSDLVLAFTEKFGRPVSSFRGKVVWITGASTGLGEAMAYELATVGAQMILSARNRVLLEKVKEECIELSKGRLEKKDILVLSFDISDIDSHQTHVENAINQFERIDVFINNAARYQIGPTAQTQPEVMKELFDVNFFGGANLTRLLLNHFLENGRGQIIGVSSIAGKFGIPAVATYVASKHALQGFYETLRMEYHKDKISVTVVNPGIFKSSMMGCAMSTEKGEMLHKENQRYECNNMTVERCCHLTLVSAANKLFESWIGYQPFLLMIWGSQYAPDLYRYIMMKIYTKKRVTQLNEGIWPGDLPVWRPLLS